LKSASLSTKQAGKREGVGHLPSVEERREKMKRVSWILIGLMIFMAGVTTTALAMVGGQEMIGGPAPKAPVVKIKAGPGVSSTPTPTCTGVLLAGQKYEIGRVEIDKSACPAGTMTVKYLITQPGWAIVSTHLHVADTCSDIPQANGNPIPGKFAYKNKSKDPFEATYSNLPCRSLIAAHAKVVRVPSTGDLIAYAGGDQVTFSVQHPYDGGPSYFPQVNITTPGGLYGTYLGWCVDTGRRIDVNTPYCAKIASSYDPISQLGSLIDKPENLDLVNWIINQDFVGKASACLDGSGNPTLFTYGDVQRAIWALIDDSQSSSGLGPWEQCRVDQIMALAKKYGEGFIPGCGQKLAVILKPVTCGTDTINAQIIIAQVVIIEGMLPCGQDETAWGAMKCGDAYKCPFPGKNWALFITCPETCDCPTCPLPKKGPK
jgi:hypothetical protein